MKDLTVSNIDRQNILNNNDAILQIQNFIGITGMYFEDEYTFTKQQISEFYVIDSTTIDRYLEKYEIELKHNGYKVLRGQKLKDFKEQFLHLLGDIKKANQLGVFNFRAFLNLGMLLVESEMARAIRGKMLDIVIDLVNQKLGGSVKYINQRDEDFLTTILKEPLYRKEFTSALNKYLEMGNFKYAYYTDEIYKYIFKENSTEYKKILQLQDADNLRDTMYAEVLKLISSFEIGIAHEMKLEYERLGRKLHKIELDNLIKEYANHPLYHPLVENARSKMATRDYGFRRVLHQNLEKYVDCISNTDFERFLGERSKSLEDRIDENIDVFKRLKNR